MKGRLVKIEGKTVMVKVEDDNDRIKTIIEALQENPNFKGFICKKCETKMIGREVSYKPTSPKIVVLYCPECQYTQPTPQFIIGGMPDLGKSEPPLKLLERMSRCQFCGRPFPKWRILDPNIFPDNDIDDTWKVCTSCREFINMSMFDHQMKFLSTIQEKIEQEG